MIVLAGRRTPVFPGQTTVLSCQIAGGRVKLALGFKGIQAKRIRHGTGGVMSTSALALTLFIVWTLLLLVLMEAIRSWLVVSGRSRSNEFKPDNANLSPFMQRLARAHANCVEGFPVFGGLLLVAIVTDLQSVTDPLAPWLVGARVVQSSIHLASLSVLAVNLRFTFFAVQMAIAVYWAWALLAA
jgi:uncharacterized MAPEG superfamily protein